MCVTKTLPIISKPKFASSGLKKNNLLHSYDNEMCTIEYCTNTLFLLFLDSAFSICRKLSVSDVFVAKCAVENKESPLRVCTKSSLYARCPPAKATQNCSFQLSTGNWYWPFFFYRKLWTLLPAANETTFFLSTKSAAAPQDTVDQSSQKDWS